MILALLIACSTRLTAPPGEAIAILNGGDLPDVMPGWHVDLIAVEEGEVSVAVGSGRPLYDVVKPEKKVTLPSR